MNARDLATVAFRTLAAWLFVSGITGLSSALITWRQNEAQYGKDVAIWNLAASALYIPIGAMGWLVSDWASRRSFPTPPTGTAALDRSDLYAFASVLVGLFLLTDALTQIVYWTVLWRSGRGPGFWRAASEYESNGVVFSVHVKAQVAATVAKTILGLILVNGPDRIKAGLLRIRRELSSSLDTPDASNDNDVGQDGA